VITAAGFMAAIGEVRRFADRKKLVGYLGHLILGGALRRLNGTATDPNRTR
jgi:hypothetical protein